MPMQAQALKSAIGKGFADLAAITGNACLNSLRNEPQYLQMIQGLQGGHSIDFKLNQDLTVSDSCPETRL